MGMNMVQQEALLNFMEKRKELILRLESKRLNKESFLDENYFLIRRLGLKPYMQLKTREECLLNYQYYNCLAKENLRFSFASENSKKRKLYDNKAQNYYNEKDKATKRMVELTDGSDMEAYYIVTSSRRLDNVLFEIYIRSIPFVILHSMNNEIKAILSYKNAFTQEKKKSRIHNYVNCLY
ncbi:hypothetical protein HMPREF1987_00317 [Peptostreptococcaceae bacterium oral taxon 113 str. W5053]|nr:hypothetical protein HMPREF1987_00317 [Peptostreptococcaceae bacterium oral taxon 113 str. W5053]